MAILNRSALKLKFKSNVIPTKNDFCDLIDSALNRKSDCFYGKWMQNYKYKNGDVVLYGKTLYKLVLDAPIIDCPPSGDPGNEGGEGDKSSSAELPTKVNPPTDITDGDLTYCSTDSPDKDDRWCMLEFQVDDDDWEVKEIDGICVLVPKKDDSLVGIGTGDNLPAGLMEINQEDIGKIIFAPTLSDQTAIQIQSVTEGTGTIQVRDGYLEFLSDTDAGFAFSKSSSSTADEMDMAKSAEDVPSTQPFVVLNTDENNNPKIGIGTTNPDAVVDIQSNNQHQILLQPADSLHPQIMLGHLNGDQFENYLSASTEDSVVLFRTDTTNGFHFKNAENERTIGKMKIESKSGGTKKNNEEKDPSLLSVLPTGKVGIGTDQPQTELDVHHEKKGNFQMSFKNTNPVFSVINRQPKMHNFMGMGTDNDYGILMTDSTAGMKFKAAKKPLKKGETPEINDGEDLMVITPSAELGIGKKPTYHLDVEGKTHAKSAYLNTDTKFINIIEPLSEALDKEETSALHKICELKPIVFEWKKNTKLHGDGQHIGLAAHAVADIVPEAARMNHDDSRSVEYGNLVALLIAGIQEQQAEINMLSKKIQELEGK